MRILVDANVFISYLLAPDSQAGATRTVQVLFADHPELDALVSETSIEEVQDAARRKAYLAERILPSTVTSLLNSLEHVVEIVPAVARPLFAISRDRNDDYLLVTARLHDVDHIVTGDRDLQVLDPYAGIRIISPAEFMALLDLGLTF